LKITLLSRKHQKGKFKFHFRRDTAFQYLKGAYRKDGEGLFTMMCSDRTRQNGYKLKRADLD